MSYLSRVQHWFNKLGLYLVAMLLVIVVIEQADAQTAEPVCVGRIPSSVTMSIDGSRTGDWDTFAEEIDYDGTGDYRTWLAADGTHIYFFTEVTGGDFGDLPAQGFLIAASTTTDRMLQIQPFDAGDAPSKDDKDFDSSDFITNPFGGGWNTWASPSVPTTDFHRYLDTTTPVWRLEGRIALADLNITDLDDFDLFLHISSGSSGAQRKPWPSGQTPDLGDPATVTFGANRCPDMDFSEPYLNFGKVPLGSSNTLSVTLSNDGASGSELEITNAALDPSGGHFSLPSVTKDADGSPVPFTLSTSETATATVDYQPTASSSLGSPHVTELQVESNDPDEDLGTLPIQGNARQYIDFQLILDQSGSMRNTSGSPLGQSKWVMTEWASEIAHEVLRLFSMSQDRVGAVWFGGTSSNPDAGQLAPLDFFPSTPESFTSGFSDAQSDYYTPIGLGIEAAHDRFGSPSQRMNVGLLMSDGLHNRPSETEGATTVEGLLLPSSVENNSKSMHIHTVAIGSDAGVSTDLLDDIKDHYQTGSVAATYNITEAADELAEFFVEPLMEHLIVNHVAYVSSVSGFPIPQGAHAVLGMVVWMQGTTPADIIIEVSDDTGGGPLLTTYDSSTSGYYKGTDSDQPYTYILIDDPDELTENRTWRILDKDGHGILADVGVPLVLEDLNIIAHFTAHQDVDGTGNDYILKVKLTEAGRPITNTVGHPVEVKAQIARPGEGFGHLVSTVSLEDCQQQDPVLPQPRQDVSHISLLHASMDRSGRMFLGDTTGADPPDFRFQWADAYFQRCDRENLLRIEEPGLELFDDGTQGDEVSNDGIYTLVFSDTDYEGSYVVRFWVNGTSPTGARFSRTRTLSTFIPVDVDPSATNFDSRIYDSLDEDIIWEFYVTPADRFGRYLGPGRGDVIEFQLAGPSGRIVESLRDYNNGIYSVLVRSRRGEPAPDVRVSVQGKDIPLKRKPHPIEFGDFVGITFFDSSLGLDDGATIGIRLGYPLSQSFTAEGEGAVTFTEDDAGNDGHVFQLIGSARVDLIPAGTLIPYFTAGIGAGFFLNFASDDDAFLYHGGVGLRYRMSRLSYLRGEVRLMRTGPLYGLHDTTNYQVTLGAMTRLW